LFSIRTFRFVALAEATSFLILLTSSVIKRTSAPEGAETAVLIFGSIHGALFVSYVLIALVIRDEARWTAKQTILVLLGAVIPFGGFVVDRWLAKTGQLGRG
jgi:integral membrane protein